jgi:hypothetical protein
VPPDSLDILLREVDWLKALGTNTLSFGPNYAPGPDGSLQPIAPDMEETVLRRIEAVHAVGLRVYLVLGFWTPEQIPTPAQAETLLSELEPLVLKWAALAEQHGVELFSPANEPDLFLEAANLSAWHQRLLPQIRARYGGLVLPKLASAVDMDYRGFDYIGLDIIGWRPREYVEADLETMLGYAQRDGVPGVILAEFGAMAEAEFPGEEILAVGEQKQAQMLETVFQVAQGKVAGYFVIAPIGRAWGVRGRPAEEVVASWFGGEAAHSPGESGWATIRGEAHYTGNKIGELSLALWESWPPAGPPLLAVRLSPETTDFSLDLPPGSYYLNFSLPTAAPGSPPAPGDPVFWCGPLQVSAGETITLQLALSDADTGAAVPQACPQSGP